MNGDRSVCSAMQCSLPHEASTTWLGETEPWASIQLRRRRPYAVDGLAISSQSPFRFVGEKFPIANPLLDNTTPSDAIIAPRGRGTSPQSIPALAAFEEVSETVKFGVGQGIVLGEGSHRNSKCLGNTRSHLDSHPRPFPDFRHAHAPVRLPTY